MTPSPGSGAGLADARTARFIAHTYEHRFLPRVEVAGRDLGGAQHDGVYRRDAAAR